jgi:replication factor C subunit 3/5
MQHIGSDASPWVEKYRPTNFENIVLDPINQKLFSNILEKNYFPNLLFYGPPGTGKTTTIINLINEYQKRYYKTPNKNLVIHLNASDERGIDIIRNHIYQFIKTKNMFDIGMKFVILDEVDYMTKNAQQALKYLLQTCNQNVRFCLICNYISKIEESLQNEFICIRFNQLPKLDILQFIKQISENERLNLSDESINTIQTMFSSDMRSMINFIQLNTSDSPITCDWDKKIINQKKLAELDCLLNDPSISLKDMKSIIHNISVQYNIDKKSILLKYVNFLIQQKKYTSAILDILGNILHNGDVKTDILLDYFIFEFRNLNTANLKYD